MKNINIIYSILFTILKLSSTLLLLFFIYLYMPIDTTQTVTLPKGSITKTINALNSQGYNLNKIDAYIIDYILDKPKSGTLLIGKKSMSRIKFLQKLSSAKEAIDIITLIPGETRPIFLEQLSKKYNLDRDKLEQEYNRSSPYQEAGIIPDTYHISKNSTEEKVIKTLIQQSEKRYREIAINKYKKYDKKEWIKVLTIASIIQKESANRKEMPTIASVIYNRLQKNMPLQMDGTLNYGNYSHIKVTPKRIKEDNSKFNTYKHKGLPPYPICSVSIDAIKATLNPQQTNYIYFMRNKDGVHDFTNSYKEHLKNIQKVKESHN